MFGDILSGAASSAEISLGDLFDFKNGINFSSEMRGEGVPVVDVLNMYTDDIFVSTGSLYRVDVELKQDMALTEGDILFVRSSVKREGVGWASLFPGGSEPMTHCGFIIRARSKKTTPQFRPHYLVHYLRLPKTRAQLIAHSGQVAITNINQEKLGLIRVPLAELSKQVAFERLARSVESERRRLKSQVAGFGVLFSSLQHRAFSGQL